MLYALGSTHARLQQQAEAITYFQQALPLYQTQENRSGTGKTLMSLGVAQFNLGEHQLGMDSLRQALQLAQAGGGTEAAALIQLILAQFETALEQA